MKVGDLVKYKIYPHECLGHLLGLVVETCPVKDTREPGIFVRWNQDRSRGPANTVMYEFRDELEIVNESR